MAIKEVQIDDITGEEGAIRRQFGLGGESFEIDLVDKNYENMKQVMEPFIKHARRKGQAPRRLVAHRVSSPQSAADNDAIREWARQNGHKVSDRGRVRREVVEAFNAAHKPKAETKSDANVIAFSG